MADIDIDELIRQFGNNYPKWVNDAIGSRLENTNKLLKELQKQKTASNPEFKKEVDTRKQLNKELVAEQKLTVAQNKTLKETNDLYKNLKQNLGGLVKNIDKFKKDLDSMSAQSNTKDLAKQSKELTKETAARKELTKTVDRQTINQVTYILTQKELNKTTRILDKQFGGLSKTIDVLVKKISSSDISNSKPVDVDFTAFNKSMMAFQTQMDGVIKKQDDFAKKIQRITSSINEPINQDAIDDNQEAVKGYKQHIKNASKSLKDFDTNINKSTQSLGQTIQSMNNLSGVSSVAAGAIGGLVSKIPLLGVLGVALGAGVGHVIDEMLIARTAFSQLSTNGFGLGTDLIGLSRIARDGKMSIEDFQTAIAQNKAAFMALGPDAAQIFSKLQADAKETGTLFKKFGMSLDETTEFLSDNLEYQRSTGRLRDMSDAQRSMMADQELMRLAKVSATFGKSVKEITTLTTEYMKSSNTVASIIQITQGMQQEDRQRVMGNMTDIKESMAGSDIQPEMQKMLMQTVEVQIAKREGRQLLNAESQKTAQLMTMIPELDAYIKQTVQSGETPVDFAANVANILQTKFQTGENAEILTRMSLASANPDRQDPQMVAFANSVLSTIGNTYGLNMEGVQSRVENTEDLRNQEDAALDAINSAEDAINTVQITYKKALIEMFGSEMGTQITNAITDKITGATENLDGFMNNILDPNYTGQPLDNITELLTGKESVGDLSASDINTDKLAMVAAGYKLGGPLGAIAAMFMGDDAIKKQVESALEMLGTSKDVQQVVSPYAEKMILYGILGSRFGPKGMLVGVATGIAHAGIEDILGKEITTLFGDTAVIPEFDPTTNIPEHLKNNPMVGGVSGVTLNPDGTINRGGSVVQQWKNSGQLQGGDNSNTLPSTVDDDYEGGLKLTPQGNPDLLLGTDAKDSYEMFAQAHHDIMAPVFRELHADTMKNLFIKNTDAIDTIFTKSLDKFLYTKSSIEGIITASGSEQGLSPAQIKQLEVMGMGSMNSGGLIPMEARIGGTTSTSIGEHGITTSGYRSSGYVGGDTSREQTAKMVYDQFINAGFSENQAEILTAEVNRENVFNEKELYGTHIDPKNKALNRGMFSWQGDRAPALMDFLKNEGVLDAQGNMIPGQETLNAQAKFAKLEMQQNLHGGSTQQNKRIQGFLQNPNIDQETGHRIMGKDFIRWAYGEPGIHANSMDRINEGHMILQRALQNNATQTVPNNNNMVKYNMGPNRPFKPDEDLINSVSSQVEKIFGIGSKINVISGQEGDLPQYGQARHKTGLAADFDIYDSEGNIVTFGDPRLKEFMIDAAQNQGIKGIGLGPEYMKGPANAARFHMDKLAHSLYSGNMDETWGSLANKYEAEIEEAMAFFDKNVNIVQQSMTSKIDDLSADSSMTEVEKLRQKLDTDATARKSKLQSALMDPDRNEPIQMKYTTSEEEAKQKDRMKGIGATTPDLQDSHIERYLREIANETKRARRATEKNGSGLAPGSPAC